MRWFLILFAGVGIVANCLADGPVFEAASVKAVEVNDSVRGGSISGGPGTSDPGRFTASYALIGALVFKAFNLPHEQVVLPSWAMQFGSNFYSVSATMPLETTQQQFQKMMQNLLIDRFHMTAHHETREFQGYELVVDNDGPKLQEAEQSSSPNMTGHATLTGVQQLKYQEWTMEKFAAGLGNQIAVSMSAIGVRGPVPRVIEKTGLSGNYTFALEFSSAERSMQSSGGGASLDPGSGVPNIFDAIRKQLGLRLVKIADIPLDVVVIDHLDKVPTPD